MAGGVRRVLQQPQRGRGGLQGSDEERPTVPAVYTPVLGEPPPQEERGAGVHPIRHNQDHQVPPPHRATHQDGQGQASRSGALEAGTGPG